MITEDMLVKPAATVVTVRGVAGTPINSTVMIQVDDNRRIRRHLKLPLSHRLVVQSQMDLVTRDDPDAISDIQRMLAALDVLETVRDAQSKDGGKSFLIRADVLEWLPMGQTMTVKDRQKELRCQLINYLDLGGWVGSAGVALNVRS